MSRLTIMEPTTLPLATRRAAFETLISLQDRGLRVGATRAETARRFGLTLRQVSEIEQEGLECGWPPLDE